MDERLPGSSDAHRRHHVPRGATEALTRFGVNREHSNALARSSYEETCDVLTEAAVFGEDTPAEGVSTSIILGQRARVGTGVVDAVFHASMLPHALATRSVQQTRLAKSAVAPPNMEPCNAGIEYVVELDSSTGGDDAMQTHAHVPFGGDHDSGDECGFARVGERTGLHAPFALHVGGEEEGE